MHDITRSKWLPLFALPLVISAAIAAAFGGSSSTASAARGGVAGARGTLKSTRLSVRSTHYGKALFGPSGKVLYVFGPDRRNKSRCYGVCAKAWPPLLTKGKPLASSGVKAKLLGTTKRKNGRLQVTYNGHPLYYYSADTRMKIMCQHAKMHGGLWLIIKPNGKPNMAMGKMHM